MIYFTSDTHFNHTNIIRYCNRPFNCVDEMNNSLVQNWNKIITNNDVVYHLGDFALGMKEQANDIIKKLKGTIYLIRGNHDNWSLKTYEKFGFYVLKNAPIRLDEYKLILSHVPIPDCQIPNGFTNIHGHIHNKNLYECGEGYEPSSYSLDKHINISCDVTNFKPVSIEKILEIKEH